MDYLQCDDLSMMDFMELNEYRKMHYPEIHPECSRAEYIRAVHRIRNGKPLGKLAAPITPFWG